MTNMTNDDYKTRTIKVSFGKIYAVIISLLPIFYSIRFPFTDIGISYIVCIILIPFLCFKLIGKELISRQIIFVWLFFVYFMYRTEGDYLYYFVFCAVCIVHILSIYNRIVDFEFLKKMIVGISMFASICVILQTLVYYSLGFHIQMMSVSFISSGLEGYDTAFRMGMGSSGGMYRPSAFFFEPAHFCQYAVVGLLMALYHYAKGKTSIKYSILISFGMICTTSSQGLVFMLLAWVWGIYVKRGNMTTKMFRIIVILTLLILAVGICYVTGLFHVDSIINRVIGTVDGYNAIAGRNFANELYLSQLSGKSLLWGVGYVNRPDVYMTGIVVYRYTIGYIGCALFYLALLFSVRKIDRISFAVAVAYGGLLCVASATSVVSFIFYMGITYSELKEIKTEGRSRKISVKFRRKFDSL